MTPAAGLLPVSSKHVDSALASLFESSAGPVVKAQKSRKATVGVGKSNGVNQSKAIEPDDLLEEQFTTEPTVESALNGGIEKGRRKRKRDVDEHEDLEDKFFKKLQSETRDDSDESVATESESSKQSSKDSDSSDSDSDAVADNSSTAESFSGLVKEERDEISDEDDVIPIHESLNPAASITEAASRTVFLGNVSTAAVTSKASKRSLLTHLSSILSQLPTPADGTPHELVSIRFRSTPYEAILPNKRAAFAKRAIMDATSPNTNAYVVYSSAAAARAACLKLNGTIVLGRHLRVDSVAHPASQDPKRCVFVGNLGFTAVEPDEPEANPDTEDGKQNKIKKKKKLPPQDPEEGLWTHFSTCGAIESVRVVRDSKTRIGKGFAYVQFMDANAVEKALLLNDQKFPPMLPRKLRVVRARKTKKRDSRDAVSKRTSGAKGGTEEERSLRGRAGKLLGKGGARQLNQTLKSTWSGEQRRKPNGDSAQDAGKMTVFEGQRASAKDGNKGLKFGKKKGKPSNRSVRRAAAWRKGKQTRS